MEIREAKLGKFHSRVAQTLKHLLTLYELQELFDKALEYGKRASSILARIYGPDSVPVANTEVRLGQSSFLKDGPTSIEGKKHIEKAVEIYTTRFGKDSDKVTETKKILQDIEEEFKQKEQAQTKKSNQSAFEELVKEATTGLRSNAAPKVINDFVLAPGEIPTPPPPPPIDFWKDETTSSEAGNDFELFENIKLFKAAAANKPLKKTDQTKRVGREG